MLANCNIKLMYMENRCEMDIRIILITYYTYHINTNTSHLSRHTCTLLHLNKTGQSLGAVVE